MRKYVSLGAAMMVGAVIAREKKSSLQKIHRLTMEYEATNAFKNAHLERATAIPKNDIVEVEHRYDSIETSNSPNVQVYRDSIDTSRTYEVLNTSRERPQRQIKRKESPNAPNVKQWFCGGHLFLPYG
jgi:uncharacterized protein (DUF1786 family)